MGVCMTKSKIEIITIFTALLFLAPQGVRAEDMNVKHNTFVVKLGVKRIVYHEGSRGVQLDVENPQNYPILVQSNAIKEDKLSKAEYFVSPPLFKLEGQRKNKIRIIGTDLKYSGDRETLNWLCIKAIPPSDADLWSREENKKLNKPSLSVNTAVTSCIKLIYRPENITGSPENYYDKLNWRHDKGELYVKNPTPFVMTITKIKANGQDLKHSDLSNLNVLPPFSEQKINIQQENIKLKNIEWNVMTDYGGDSKVASQELK